MGQKEREHTESQKAKQEEHQAILPAADLDH
jgi:hypothetical protein